MRPNRAENLKVQMVDFLVQFGRMNGYTECARLKIISCSFLIFLLNMSHNI